MAMGNDGDHLKLFILKKGGALVETFSLFKLYKFWLLLRLFNDTIRLVTRYSPVVLRDWRAGFLLVILWPLF